MKIQGTHTFDAPQDVVWPMLLDPEVLANVMPGCEKLEKTAENQYEGILMVRVGPVQGKFNGIILLENIQAPNSYDLTVDGKGPSGFVKGTGSLRLEEDNGQTIMHYDGDVNVGGRIASVGQRLLDTSAKAIIRQSLTGLENQVQARVQPAAATTASQTGSTSSPPPAPSQTEFALGVAKNFAEELIPPEQRGEVAAKIAAILTVLLLSKLISDWWTKRLARQIARHLDRERR
ncbi:MAG: carbon monoxide dehydrogenase subunit G [Chloroflexota bacterium]|jgi:uncharacterized protein